MKKIVMILLSCMLILSCFGCSGDNKGKTIVIYTCQEEERIQAMNDALANQFPDLDIIVEQVGTGNLAARLLNEGTDIEADIIIDLECSHLENLKDNFADLSEFDTSVYLDGTNPSHHKYVLWVKNYGGIIVDKDYFAQKGWQYPTSYDDLLDEKYADLIAISDPVTSGTGYAYYLNLVNLGKINENENYFEKLKANCKQIPASGSGPINLLKQGEIVIAMGMVFQGVNEINKGANYEVIQLDTGAVYNITGAGIIAGREENEDVNEVFQYLISKFHYVDCQEFVPGKILINQETKVANYKEIELDADMQGIADYSLKNKLLTELSSK